MLRGKTTIDEKLSEAENRERMNNMLYTYTIFFSPSLRRCFVVGRLLVYFRALAVQVCNSSAPLVNSMKKKVC